MTDLVLRDPTPSDAPRVARLVKECGSLEPNSTYAYAITLWHFPRSCVVATDGDALVGAVVGHPLPPDAWFVWQIGVAPRERGRGLATAMLSWRVDSDPAIRFVHATVTPSNVASRRLFEGFARRLEADLAVGPGLDSAALGPLHEPEQLFRIGPIPRRSP